MENVFIVFVCFFFALLAFTIVKERAYQRKRKKVEPGARFNYMWSGDAAPITWVTVVEVDYYRFIVYYRVDGNEEIFEMHIRTFVKKYVPWRD